jgi:hypothetical protein
LEGPGSPLRSGRDYRCLKGCRSPTPCSPGLDPGPSRYWRLRLEGPGSPLRCGRDYRGLSGCYSTVTDFARFLGLSTSVPFSRATW